MVSGGYPDDQDYGDEIVYTGQGGRSPSTGRQVEDQKLVFGNVGLVRSQLDTRPVRVIRGAGGDPRYSPTEGLRYDGLFQVVDHWHDVGQDGFRIWRYRLAKIAHQAILADPEADVTGPAARSTFTGARIIRSRAVAERVKRLYDHRCQICGIQLLTAAGPYAEGAHIRGLGRPHDGPDDPTNVLCLCPNHHLLFDTGAVFVDADGNVCDAVAREIVGPLRILRGHRINPDFLRYHRDHFAIPVANGTT